MQKIFIWNRNERSNQWKWVFQNRASPVCNKMLPKTVQFHWHITKQTLEAERVAEEAAHSNRLNLHFICFVGRFGCNRYTFVRFSWIVFPVGIQTNRSFYQYWTGGIRMRLAKSLTKARFYLSTTHRVARMLGTKSHPIWLASAYDCKKRGRKIKSNRLHSPDWFLFVSWLKTNLPQKAIPEQFGPCKTKSPTFLNTSNNCIWLLCSKTLLLLSTINTVHHLACTHDVVCSDGGTRHATNE